MARKLLAGVVSAAVLGSVGAAAAARVPIVRSVGVVHRHLVLVLRVGDLRPAVLVVAKRRAVDASGVLLSRNVRTRETIGLPAVATGTVRWRTPDAFRPGIYFVQVMAVETDGVTDCVPKQRNCNQHWSSVRRVVVRRSN
jgi:hypothetical protein